MTIDRRSCLVGPMSISDTQARVLVVWHSRTGASEQMAKEVAQAASREVTTACVRAGEVCEQPMLDASAYIFICPENLGSMSGEMKEFFDRLYYPLLGRIEGRAYATIIAAGSDGSGAERQIDRIVTGWRLKRVADPLIVNFDAQTPEEILAHKSVSPEALRKARELGAAIGGGVALGVF